MVGEADDPISNCKGAKAGSLLTNKSITPSTELLIVYLD